jgi:deoxyribose-phosphate aldolase
VKAHEARLVRSQGADEIDMVLNIGWVRSGELARVEDEIGQVVAAADGAVVKVILENAYLSDEQKVLACKAVEAAGADYVKTSTGFAPTGATVEDIRLMRASVSPRVKVKAAHGVRTLDALLDVMEAGADRCGATATAGILDDFLARAGA